MTVKVTQITYHIMLYTVDYDKTYFDMKYVVLMQKSRKTAEMIQNHKI